MSPASLDIDLCPRCDAPLVRNHDELVCMVHGTIVTPVRAWDGVSNDVGELEPGKTRRRGATTPTGVMVNSDTEPGEYCPRCHRTHLIEADGLTYCQACGYESPESLARPAPPEFEEHDEGEPGMTEPESGGAPL